jgi:hypothetical protein
MAGGELVRFADRRYLPRGDDADLKEAQHCRNSCRPRPARLAAVGDVMSRGAPDADVLPDRNEDRRCEEFEDAPAG